MASLGDLYFDVLLRDNTDKQIQGLKKKLGNLNDIKVKVGVNKVELSKDIRNYLKQETFKINLKLDDSVSKAFKDAVDNAEKFNKKIAEVENSLIRAAAQARNLGSSMPNGSMNTSSNNNDKLTMVSKQIPFIKSELSSLWSMVQQFTGAFSAVEVVQRLVEIRGEFERDQVALKALMQSATQAEDMFGKLQTLAIKSPYNFSQVLSFTKQLSSFQISNRDLYDTTKRLADLASGLGVDMGRIILAYGQVKTATILKGTELKQFTEAGVPMLELLARKFSQLQGKIVTTGEVTDMITKKLVPFSMVKDVITDLTSEGGRFYNMQEKQAETLYGRVSNLKDAYDVMINQIGTMADRWSLLKGPIGLIGDAMSNWQSTLRVIVDLIAAIGVKKMGSYMSGIVLGSKTGDIWKELKANRRNAFEESIVLGNGSYTGKADYNTKYLSEKAAEGKLSQAMANRLLIAGKINKTTYEAIALSGKFDQAIAQNVKSMGWIEMMGKRLKLVIGDLSGAMAGLWSAAWPMLLITALTHVVTYYMQCAENISSFNENIRNQAKETNEDVSNYLKSNREPIQQVIEFKVTREEAEKVWQSLKEEIEKLANGDSISIKLAQEDNIYKRVQQANDYLNAVEKVSKILSESKQEFSYTQSGVFDIYDGVAADIEDLGESIEAIRKKAEKAGSSVRDLLTLNYPSNFSQQDKMQWNDLRNGYKDYFDEANKEIAKSLSTSLELALDEVKSRVSPKDIPMALLAAYNQVMPEILKGMGATTTEAKEMVEIAAMDVLTKAGADAEDALFANETLVGDFLDRIKNEARKEGQDLGKLVINDSDDTIKSIVQKTLNNASDVTNDVYNKFVSLANNISKLKAVINVKLNIGGTDNNVLQTYINDVVNDKTSRVFNGTKEQRYGRFINTQETSLSGWEKALQTEKKSLDDQRKQINHIKATTKKNSKSYKQALEDEKKLDQETKQINNTANDFGLSLVSDKDAKKNETAKNKADAQRRKAQTEREKRERDYINGIKNQYKEYLDAVKEIKKMRKSMGLLNTDKAMKELGLFSNLDSKLLEEFLVGGEKAMEKHFKPLVKYNNKEGKSLLAEMSKNTNNAELEKFNEALKKTTDLLKDLLKLSDENWKMYDKLLAKTGDKNFSALFGLGNIRKLYDTLSAEKIAKFNDMMSKYKVTFEELKELPVTEISSKYGEDIGKIFESIKDSIKDEKDDLIEQMADALGEMMTDSEKKAMTGRERNDFIEKWLKQFGDTFLSGLSFDSLPVVKQLFDTGDIDALQKMCDELDDLDERKQSLKGLIAVLKSFNKQIDDLTTKIYESSDAWKDLMDDSSDRTIAKREEHLKKLRKELEKLNEEERTASPDRKKAIANEKKTISSKIDSINSGLNEQNPFRSIIDNISKLKSSSNNGEAINEIFGNNGSAENIDSNTEALGGLFAAISKIASAIQELGNTIADFLGEDDQLGMKIQEIADIAGGASQIADGISKAYQGDALSGFTEMVQGAFNIVKAFKTYADKVSEAIIKKMATNISKIKNQYGKVSTMISRRLGGAYSDYLKMWREVSKNGFTDELFYQDKKLKQWASKDDSMTSYMEYAGGVYMAQLERLKKQREDIYAQAEAERDKSNTDEDKLVDYQSQINEIDDQITYFAEDTLQELMDVDLKSWAEQLGDALVDAFASGSDAAKAFDDTVSSIIKGMAKKMISLYVIEPLMTKVEDYLFGTNGAFSDDYKLDANEMEGLMEVLEKVKDGTEEAKELYDIINEAAKANGIDLSDSSSSTLGKGIQSITESTADLLASYLNAIRADVSIMRQIQQGGEGNTAIFQSQLQQLNSIAQSTQRSADAAEEISSIMNSLVYVSTKGKALRI